MILAGVPRADELQVILRAAMVAAALLGCASPTEIRVRFEDPALAERAELVEVTVALGACDQEPAACPESDCPPWSAAAGEQPEGNVRLPQSPACLTAIAYAADTPDPDRVIALGAVDVREDDPSVEIVLRAPRIAHVAAGRGHTCAAVRDVGVYCWGYNMSGECGNGAFDLSAAPSRVDLPDGDVIALAAGGYDIISQNGHSCAIVDAAGGRALYCWGNNDDGQLGDGTTTSHATPVRVDLEASELGGAVGLALGGGHTCLTTSAGGFRWRCWGRNREGQLGQGEVGAPVLTPPAASETPPLMALSTSHQTTCGTTGARSLFCFGDGRGGQTGGPLALQPSARQVPTFSPVGTFATGSSHVCALLDDAVRCFGQNDCAQVDPAASDGACQGGLMATDVVAATAASTVDVPREAGERIEQLAAGGLSSCARLSSGRVYCWGGARFGELGAALPDEAGSAFVQLEDGRPLEGAAEVSIGTAHACAVTEAGELYCWGRNHHNRVQPAGIDCSAGMMPECNQPFAGRVFLP